MSLLNRVILITILIIPTYTYAYSEYVIPGGKTIGIEVNSKGIKVIGFYKVNNKYIARDAGFRENDTIIKVNNKEVSNINEMTKIISESTNVNTFTVLRNSKEKIIKFSIPKSDNIIKTGLYVKDKITGIGTLSYIDPTTKIFASLGHEILESNTMTKFEIKDGTIYKAEVSSIIKSVVGSAGEKNATSDRETIYGIVSDNKETGIYGQYTEDLSNLETIKVAKKEEVTTGKAIIKTVIKDNLVEEFTINIIKLDHNHKTKNILFEITDENLLEKTGGIIQGMSGSPIIQNNKLIGAVNYVVVNDPSKGYGIFIETMLEEGEN